VTANVIILGAIRGQAVVVVGAANEAELVWIRTWLRLVVESLLDGPAHDVILRDGAPAERPDAVAAFEIRELVGRPELAVYLRVALDLHHLCQPLEMAAQVSVLGRHRLAGRCCAAVR
jgi:hypothetical protein